MFHYNVYIRVMKWYDAVGEVGMISHLTILISDRGSIRHKL